jgi:DNA-binding GntR family transcriptional regulator
MATPRHQQLAELLLGQIADGTYALGDPFPTEIELAEAHGMARGTVRRALSRLEQLGMISRRPRVGTVVIATRPVAPYQAVAQSAKDIAQLAAETRLVKPTMGRIVLDAPLARRLGARRGGTWFRMQGRRVRRSEPAVALCWSEHYSRGATALENLLHGTVDLDEMEDQRVVQTIAAELLEPQVAAELDAAPGDAALVITRKHFDGAGRLVGVGIHTHPADRYRITTTL